MTTNALRSTDFQDGISLSDDGPSILGGAVVPSLDISNPQSGALFFQKMSGTLSAPWMYNSSWFSQGVIGQHVMILSSGDYMLIPFNRENFIGQNFEVDPLSLLEIEGCLHING